jgi:hypothetical protein
MQNGTDYNYIREPSAITGGSTGNWRRNGMQAPGLPSYAAIASSATAIRPNNASTTGTYSYLTRATDTDDTTYATGSLGKTVTYIWTSNFASAACTLYVDHSARGANSSLGPANPKFDIVDTGDNSTLLVEYSLNAGVAWTPILETPTFSRTTSTVVLSIGTSIANNLQVRATIGGSGNASHYIYDLRVTGGSATPVTLITPIYYAVSEAYIDTDLVEHESNLSRPDAVKILASDVTAKYGVLLTLPTKVNSFATSFYIYRSVDSGDAADLSGGFPYMYRVGNAKITDTTWTDDFKVLPTTVPDLPLPGVLTVTYPTGESLVYETNDPPPIASVAVSFQGVICYIPTAANKGHLLYYSLPATLSNAGVEKVPLFQYLDFQSPRNDTLVSAVVTNGGKSLLVFFANYTMLVNYLPQASDGVFENRVKEYVSNNRGTSGRLTCTEFTLPAGQTLVASVDALGLWVTNGVNQMDEWSRDLDWATDMAGVDLSIAELIDNTPKRRLELLYTAVDGTRAERHFFYGRLKEDGDGKQGPIHTGPHPMGVRCKHYTQIGTGWVGFSGDSSTTGDVFLEESGYSDDANGYDSSGIIPWTWTLGDTYLGGISNANILETLGSKFTSEITKAFTITVTTFRDVGRQSTHTKTLGITVPSNLYLHFYSDRFRVRYTDLTATQAPAFVGQEANVREAGPSRDR